MNSEIIKQSLVEAFEVLKDSWATKSEAIVNCIVETEGYDGNLAIDMWCYILKNNTEENPHVPLYDVIRRFEEKYAKWTTKEDYCKVIFEHILIHDNIETFVSLAFEKSMCGFDTYDKGTVGFQQALTACILLMNSPQMITIMIKSLSQNKEFTGSQIGILLTEAKYYVEAVRSHINEFDMDYKVTDIVKEAYFNSISLISDKESRAECTIAILSM